MIRGLQNWIAREFDFLTRVSRMERIIFWFMAMVTVLYVLFTIAHAIIVFA